MSVIEQSDNEVRSDSYGGGKILDLFAVVPNGIFNLLSSFLRVEEFERFHNVLQSNKQCNAHWEGNLRQYSHRAEPLFGVFTSTAALRWTLFVRHIDVGGGW